MADTYPDTAGETACQLLDTRITAVRELADIASDTSPA